MWNDGFEDANSMAAMVNFFRPTKYTSLGVDAEKAAQAKQLSSNAEETSSETSSHLSEETIYEKELLPSPNKAHAPVNARIVSDAIIGLSDGLTVPFALTAGLSALGNSKVVVFGGLAELIAGAISMGLGGYLGAKSEEAAYKATYRSTQSKVQESDDVSSEITAVFAPYHLPPSTLKDFTHHLITANSPETVVDFLMRFEHDMPEPAASRAVMCAVTIATAYFVGGFVPLIPYFFAREVTQGLVWSISIMILALFAFGYVKTGLVDGWSGWKKVRANSRGGGQMVLVGGAAAGCAMAVVRLFNTFVDM